MNDHEGAFHSVPALEVEDLVNAWRLGNLFHKWAASPSAMTQEELSQLQVLSGMYQINQTSALFQFQQDWYAEMGQAREDHAEEIKKTLLDMFPPLLRRGHGASPDFPFFDDLSAIQARVDGYVQEMKEESPTVVEGDPSVGKSYVQPLQDRIDEKVEEQTGTLEFLDRDSLAELRLDWPDATDEEIERRTGRHIPEGLRATTSPEPPIFTRTDTDQTIYVPIPGDVVSAEETTGTMPKTRGRRR